MSEPKRCRVQEAASLAWRAYHDRGEQLGYAMKLLRGQANPMDVGRVLAGHPCRCIECHWEAREAALAPAPGGMVGVAESKP
jgi:hypothetical protein